MQLNRREFLSLMTIAAAAGLRTQDVMANTAGELYQMPPSGNVRLLHFTDCHAQLRPIYFREPNVNLGLNGAKGQAPHLVGEALLKQFGLTQGSHLAHAFSYVDFEASASRFGRVGGFAHLRTLITQMREEFGPAKTLLMDGGDTWQGSGTALWTRGQDMLGAQNLLGVDVMTGHWEFTYLESEILDLTQQLNGDFIAQNIKLTEEALFDDAPAYDADTGHAFKPYTIKELGGVRVAVLGQAFPYTPIANPSRFIPNWTFGIREDELAAQVEEIRSAEKPDLFVLLSHNGMDVDLKLASRVNGIDIIMGGHTHDGVPSAIQVSNAGGKTLVTNAGSNGKFLGVMDVDMRGGKLAGYQYKLMPVFADLLDADTSMQTYIDTVREPFKDTLNEPLAVTDDLLYRRGNFNGSFDQVICDALRTVGDAQIALSPGFRWGTSILPGQTITMENVMDQTAITYPQTYVRDMTGADIKLILEDVCDNLFNPDPYYQQGGDMVRVGGLNYVCDPLAVSGDRISSLELDDGSAIEAGKNYKVSGWATVGSESPGPPVWDVLAEYLRDKKTIRIKKLNTPKLKNVDGNPGIADYDSV